MAKAAALALLAPVVVHLGVRLGIERLWITVLAYHAICVIGARFAEDSGLRRATSRRWWAASAALSVALVVGIWQAGAWVYARGWLPAETRALLLRIEPWWPIFAYSILVNPLMEELWWRGFLLPKLGLLPQAAYFGFMHFAGFVVVLKPLDAALLCLPAAFSGLFWGWMRRASGSLWPCIVTHAAADAGILLLFHAIRQGP